MSRRGCFVLQNSTACPDLNGFYVRAGDSFSDTASMDEFITDRRDFMINQLQDPSSYNCPSWSAETPRFYNSTFCYFLLQNSDCQEVHPEDPSSVLCPNVCADFNASISTAINNTKICPSTDDDKIQRNRATILTRSRLVSHCSKQQNTSSTCSPGMTLEVKQCGFSTLEAAKQYCITSTDICCQQFNVPIQDVGSSSPGTSADQSLVIIASCLGGLAVLMLLYLLVVRCISWKKMRARFSRLSKRQTSDMAKHSSTSPLPTISFNPLQTTQTLYHERLLPQLPVESQPPTAVATVMNMQHTESTLEAAVVDRTISRKAAITSSVASDTTAMRESMKPVPLHDDITREKLEAIAEQRDAHPENLDSPVKSPKLIPLPEPPQPTRSSPFPRPLPVTDLATKRTSSLMVRTAMIRPPSLPPAPPPQSSPPSSPNVSASPKKGGTARKDVQAISGTVAFVRYSFTATLPDELTLKRGDLVTILHHFDDGWVQGVEVSTNRTGVFPFACCQKQPATLS